MKLFVSLFAYAFGKQHWPNVDAATARELEFGEASTVPGFRTLHRLRKFTDGIELHTDHSTLISRARDRAAGRFLRSECDQWIAIDDDVDADDRACVALLTTNTKDVLSLAMRVRSGARDFNVTPARPDDGNARALVMGEPFQVRRVGMGMIRFPRVPLSNMAAGRPDLQWDEPNPDATARNSLLSGQRALDTAPGLFLPMIKARTWLDDDFAFCERAHEAGVELFSIVLRGVTHAGIPNLETKTPESRL